MGDPARSREVDEESAPGWLRTGRSFEAPLLVRQFPSEVAFGFLGRVLPTTEPVELRVEAHRVPADRALEILHGARAVAEAELATGGRGTPHAELEVERDTAEQLGRAVARRTQELWRVGLSFVARGESRLRVESVRARLAERLAALGFRTRVPRFEVLEALAPPGRAGDVRRPAGYWQTLPTDGVAALFPFVDESITETHGALLGLALADASPVFLDRFAHASHSWGIFGTTGSGKSFLAALTVLRARWARPELEVVVLDPLGEFAGLTRALGGEVVSIGAGAVRVNPLDPATTGGDRREKAARVGAMLRAVFPSLTDEEAARLDAAVSRLYDASDVVPTLDDLRREVGERGPPEDRLSTLLEVFRSGSLRSAVGSTTLAPSTSVVDLDLRGVPDDHQAFHLTYLLDWVHGRLRDRPGPKLVVLDEVHLLLRHRATAEFLDRVVRHVRHLSGGFLLLSQSPDDFLASAAGRSVLRNLYATGFLRLPEVSEEARLFFGLTGPEAEWLPRARLPREAGYSESLWRIGELHLPLAVVASTPEYDLLTGLLGADEPVPAASRENGPL
jgi:Helicase HerA, central domain